MSQYALRLRAELQAVFRKEVLLLGKVVHQASGLDVPSWEDRAV